MTKDAKKSTILIVDDETDILQIISARLQEVGYHVVEATTGTDALELVRKIEVDVAVLDVKMPGLDGFEVLERLRAHESPPVVIFLSAVSDLGNKLKGLYGGAADFIGKPFEPQDFLARVAAAVRTKKDLDQLRSESLQDSLTSLVNRRSFEKHLATEIRRASRSKSNFALLMVDVYGFLGLTKEYGTEAAEDCLQSIARALRSVSTEIEHLSRIGRDEFAVILPETTETEAEAFVTKLRHEIEDTHFFFKGEAISPSVIFGVAMYPDDGEDPRVLEFYAYSAIRRSRPI